MAKRPIQQNFFAAKSFQSLARLEHGGDIRRGKRKLFRPFDPKRPVHLVLRSDRAKGSWSLFTLRNQHIVKAELERLSRKHRVRIYRFANVRNHLHFVISAKTKTNFQNFLRAFSGSIAMKVTGAKKGKQIKGERSRGFWEKLAYTRVLEWGRAFRDVIDYVIQNELEILGHHTKRTLRLRP